MKRKALGKGLSALLGDDDLDENATYSQGMQQVALSQISPCTFQPRLTIDQTALDELTESIKAQGLLQPILVRRLENERYEIIAGERRWRACQQAGLHEVPVVVHKADDRTVLQIALIENMQREDLSPLEEAQGIQTLIDEYGYSQQEVAQILGRSRSAITNQIRLLMLTEPVKDLLVAGQINTGHARALLTLAPSAQHTLAQQAADEAWSVREVEKRVQQLERNPKPTTPKAAQTDYDLSRLQEQLADRLGAVVTIRANSKGAGKIEIRFSSLDALDGLITKLPNSDTFEL